MRPNWKIVLCFLVATSLTALFGINGQMGTKDKTKNQEPDLSQFPTVEFSSQKVLTEKQKKRSKKYNSGAPVISEDSQSIFLISDWDLRLPALPVKESTAVIIGEVTDAEAFLSDDRTKIYSEFTVQIQQVLKNDHKALDVSNSVVVERSGGRVKFPSGKVVVSAVNHQDLPRCGKRYLFFLTHEGPEAKKYEDFRILTAYELRYGQVFPLDKPGPGHPMTALQGTSETALLNELTVLTDTLSKSK